jgi:uncharacterized membrane protein
MNQKPKTILTLFLLGSILGSIIDTAYRSILAQQFTHIGFFSHLTNSIIFFFPVYGAGLVTIYLIRNQIKHQHIITKALIFGLSLAAVEFLAGAIAIWGFNIPLWDYSNNFLNLYGLTDALHAFYWAILGLAVDFFLTYIKKYKSQR